MPYKSAAQRGYFHANRAKLEAQGVNVAEWDRASKGVKLPKHAANGGTIWDDVFKPDIGGGSLPQNQPRRMAEGGDIEDSNPWEQPAPSPEFMAQPQQQKPEPPQLPSVTPWDQGAVEGAFQPQGENPFKPGPQVPFEVQGPLGMEKVDPNDSRFQGFGRPEDKSYGKVHDIATSAERGIRSFLGPGFNEAANKVAAIGTAISPGSGELASMQDTVNTKKAIEEGHYGEAAKEGAGALINATVGSLPGGALISKAAVAAGIMFAAKPGVKVPKSHDIAAQLEAEPGFIDTSQFKGLGGVTGKQLGYWPGGVHTAPDGTAFYLKVGPSIEQVKNENLGAKLYALAGTPVAEVGVTHIQGQPGIASKMLPNSYQLSEWKKPYSELPGLHDNFVVDAWLANHDGPGTGWENNMGNIMVSNGVATRIDTGGSLRFKGSGQPKSHFNDEADEIFSMRDPNFSETNYKVYGDVSEENLRIGAQKVANVDEKKLADAIARYGPTDPGEAQKLYDKLLKRRQYIMDHFGVEPGGKPHEKVEPFNETSPAVEAIKPESKAAVKDPYEQIPFTEEDYAKFSNEIPPWHEAVMPTEKEFGTDSPYIDVLGKKNLQVLVGGKKQSPASLKTIANTLLKDADFGQDNHWSAASHLWKIAEEINPQTAEAIFRNLPPSIQPQVGYALAALKHDIGYSPFNAVAKDSGKSGSHPATSEYNYYSTHTDKFQIPDHLKNSKAFKDNAALYGQKLAKKPEEPGLFDPEVTEALSEKNANKHGSTEEEFEFNPTPGGWYNSAKYAPIDADQLLKAHEYGGSKGEYDIDGITKDLNRLQKSYPAYADKILEHLPIDVQSSVALKYIEHSKVSEQEKLAEAYKKKLNFDRKSFSPQGDLYSFFKENNSAKIKSHFDKVVVPIKDWVNWKPQGQKVKSASLANITPEQAKELGFNPNVTLYHGSTHEKDVLQNPKLFKGDDEEAFFAHHESYASKHYSAGAMLDFIARAPKVAEVDWRKFSGVEGYSGGKKAMNALIKQGHIQGYDLIVAHNIADVGGVNTQYLFLTPQKGTIRSLTAKFDPTKLHLGHVHAGLVGGGTFVYGALGGHKDDDKMNRGGIPGLVRRAKELARGGLGSPPSNINRMVHPRHPAGMIKSSIPGRTDKIPMSVPSGSYIIPADIPSALGQGNTMAGEQILGSMFKTGRSGGIQNSKMTHANLNTVKPPGMMQPKADGGETEDIPIIAAGGEYVIHPEQVMEIGHGNMAAGHKVLDKFVLTVRKNHIDTLKKLKPPKK